MVQTLTSFERRVCEGALCKGVTTRLASQFHPSGVCFACHAHGVGAGAIPKPSSDWAKTDAPLTGLRKVISDSHRAAVGGKKEAEAERIVDGGQSTVDGPVKPEDVAMSLMKKCRRCGGDPKPIEAFRLRVPGDLGVPSKDGRIGICGQCEEEKKAERKGPGPKPEKKKDVASRRAPVAASATSGRRPAASATPVGGSGAARLARAATVSRLESMVRIAKFGPRSEDSAFVREVFREAVVREMDAPVAEAGANV